MFAMFGYPAVGAASLLLAERDDSRLKLLESNLIAAQSNQRTAESNARSFAARKERVSKRMDKLQRMEREFLAKLARIETPSGRSKAHQIRAGPSVSNAAKHS